MIRIVKSGDLFYLYDDRQSSAPLGAYDDINYLLEDLLFLLDDYSHRKEKK